MGFAETFNMARKMEKNPLAAARIRMRFLDDEISMLLDNGSSVALFWACEALEEYCYLIKRVYTPIIKTKNSVNDEMIERAKQYPVEDLIEFRNGRAMAWCHEDKTPSVTVWKGHNKVRCWTCGKMFGPIDILISRDRMSFIDAVKSLAGG
jgi:hypothetical protein